MCVFWKRFREYKENENYEKKIGTISLFIFIGVGLIVSLNYFFLNAQAFAQAEKASGPPQKIGEEACVLTFNPPKPENAPEKMRDAVMLGYNILMDTQKYASKYVGNKLNCRNCHFKAGSIEDTLSLVGVAATYPKYRTREKYSVDLVERTNSCFERSLNGKPLPANSKEMQAIMAYYHWISKGIPIYADVPWLGLKHLKSTHKPNATEGKKLFEDKCSPCHGKEGQGIVAPPLWGNNSFNDGAGMSKLENFAAFDHAFMPKGNPDLSEAQALDIAAFVTSQPRPHFEKSRSKSKTESGSEGSNGASKSNTSGGSNQSR
jgi:thiosulfate dehydrogenase